MRWVGGYEKGRDGRNDRVGAGRRLGKKLMEKNEKGLKSTDGTKRGWTKRGQDRTTRLKGNDGKGIHRVREDRKERNKTGWDSMGRNWTGLYRIRIDGAR